MAYHQTYRAVSNPVPGTVYSPQQYSLQPSVVPRKPNNYSSSSRSASPLPTSEQSYTAAPVSRQQPTNHLSGPHSPQPSRPLSSFPTNLETTVSPSPTPPISEYQQPNYRQQPRYYDSPISATTPNFPQPPAHLPTRPHVEEPTQKSQAIPSQPVSQPPPPPSPQLQTPNKPPSQLQPQSLPRASPAPSSKSVSNKSTSYSIQSQDIDAALATCLRIQNDAVTHHSKRPFAAILLAPDNQTVVLTHNSISHYQHAESELARLAAIQYNQNYLGKCTLVSTWEPCAMCSGTIYWTGIGRVIYAASEEKLKELTGANNDENMTMSLPCRTVFNSGQRNIEVIGPVPNWEAKVVSQSGKWWRENQLSKIAEKGRHERARSVSVNGNGNGNRSVSGTASTSAAGSIHEKASSVTVYDPSDSFLGSIGEDGEYQADLKVDWMR